MKKFVTLTVQLIFVALISTPIVAFAQSTETAGSSYRNVARQTLPEPTASMNPFSKLKDFSFKRPQSNGPSFFERLENLSPFGSGKEKTNPYNIGAMSASAAAGFGSIRSAPETPKFSLGKLFPPRDPSEPRWIDKVNTKTRDFLARSTEWAKPKEKMPPNWEQTSQELREQAYNVMRDSTQLMSPNANGGPAGSPQPPLRSANLNQPNVRY